MFGSTKDRELLSKIEATLREVVSVNSENSKAVLKVSESLIKVTESHKDLVTMRNEVKALHKRLDKYQPTIIQNTLKLEEAFKDIAELNKKCEDSRRTMSTLGSTNQKVDILTKVTYGALGVTLIAVAKAFLSTINL